MIKFLLMRKDMIRRMIFMTGYPAYVKRMRDLREDHDLTQQQVADLLGTSQTMYARYERGANELPIHHLITLCRFYGVSADYFLDLP
jgi:transcriptional regulator with XRE-family HTH domain